MNPLEVAQQILDEELTTKMVKALFKKIGMRKVSKAPLKSITRTMKKKMSSTKKSMMLLLSLTLMFLQR